MHAGHEHFGGSAEANPAGSVFVDAGNVKAAYTDTAGATVWASDVFVTGGKKVAGRFPVAGTDDPLLFASRRQGKSFSYAVPNVADGAYTLSLLFVDTVKKADKRLFNVFAEGERIESDLDIFTRAGGRPRTALTLTYDVTVSGGTFELELARGTKGQAVLSAFSLVPVGSTGQPPQAPAAPTNLAAESQSQTSVALAWSDNSADETGFEVERSSDGGVTFVPLLTLPAGATAHVDAGLEPGRTYHYHVRAVSDLGGASAWSQPAVAATTAAAGTPVAPSGLAALAASATSVELSWMDNSNDETAFVVERAAGGTDAFAALATLPSGTGTYRDGTAAAGTAYTYRVRATNAAGASAASNEAAVSTPGVAPVAPGSLAVTVVNGGEVRLSWADRSADETGFVVERAADGGDFAALGTTVAGATEHTDTTVEAGRDYVYRVRAANAAGQSGPSNEVAVSTPVGQPPADAYTNVAWDTRAPSPIVRAESLGGAVGGKLYVFGGFSGDEGPVKRSDAYDPATNTWTRVADMPTRLTHAGTVIDGRNFYFAGGYVGTGPAYTQVFATKAVWQYNVDTNQYTKLPDLPQARGAGGMVMLGRKLHYFGGGDLARADRAEHFVLDLDNQSAGWANAAALPSARTHMGYAALNGKIYSIGGHTGLHEDLIPITKVNVWDPASPDAWQEAEPLPAAVSHVGASTVVTGGRIVVLGGERGDANWINEVIAYDPVENHWTRLTNLPAKRFSGVAGFIDGKFYFTTGGNATTTYRGIPG